MTEFTIQEATIRKLYAASLCAETKRADRAYMQGVFVEFESPAGVRFTGTDGDVLASLEGRLKEETGSFESFTIPASFIQSLLKPASKKDSRTATVTRDFDSGEITISVTSADSGETSGKSAEIDKVFPDYRKARPDEDTMKPCDSIKFDLAKMKLFDKISRVLNPAISSHDISFFFSGNNEVIVCRMRGYAEDGYFLLMPMQTTPDSDRDKLPRGSVNPAPAKDEEKEQDSV